MDEKPRCAADALYAAAIAGEIRPGGR